MHDAVRAKCAANVTPRKSVTKNGKVSIFVASYNRRNFLRESLDSLLQQTYENAEIIVVDDGSTDGAAMVVAEYAGRHREKIVPVIKKRNKGLPDSLNIAFNLSKESEYLAFHADDDKWRPDKLEEQLAVLKKNKDIGLVHSDAELIDSDSNRMEKLFSEKYAHHSKRDEPNITKKIFLYGNYICAPSVIVRRDALNAFGNEMPYNVKLITDCYMWLVISSKYRFYYLDEPLVEYRVSPHSVQTTMPDRMRWETYSIRARAYNRIGSVREKVEQEEANNCLSRIARDNARHYASEGRWLPMLQSAAAMYRLNHNYREVKSLILTTYQRMTKRTQMS